MSEPDLVQSGSLKDASKRVSQAWIDAKGSNRVREYRIEDVSRSGAVLVDFEERDPENPMNWLIWRKWLTVCTVSLMSFVSVFATMTIVPAAPQVLEEFHSDSDLYRTLLVTIWELGEGIGPFIYAPLSEKYGRPLIFHIGNLLALCCTVCSALSINISMLIAFRFLCGAFLPILTLGPATVGDIFPLEQRGVAMALVMGFKLLAEFTSPLAGSYIAQALGWRWTVWLAAIVLGTFALLLVIVLRETYAVKILERKAARLEKRAKGRRKYQSIHQAQVDASSVINNVTMPLQILFRSPIVLLISIYTAIAYALLCLLLATITEVMESTYSFSQGSVGLTFLGYALGDLLAILLFSITSDRYVKSKKKALGNAFRLEARLVHLLLAAIVLPLGFVLYGWTLASKVDFIVPLIGTCLIGLSSVVSMLTTETYLVDVYKIHGASAIASGVILRAISAAVLPLLGPALYDSIGLGWGNSGLALIAALFIPPIVLLHKCGDWFRAKERLNGVQL